jgi:hypothetical protein
MPLSLKLNIRPLDGSLSPMKQSCDVERLQRYLRGLFAYHEHYCGGIQIYSHIKRYETNNGINHDLLTSQNECVAIF